MSRARTAFVTLALLVVVYLGWRVYTGLPWIRIAASIHAQRGALNCGDVEYAEGQNAATAAINCAIAAHAEKRPFRITFSIPGTDEHAWFALIGDSKGNAIETTYATGTVEPRNTLLQHRCSSPVQLQTTSDHPYGIPLLHCAPWPRPNLERDWLFW